MASILIALTLLLLSISSALTRDAKLNERRILLPYKSGVATNFTLDATDHNCYHWSSSRVDVAIVGVMEESVKGCSKRAQVTVVSQLAKRQSTVITATDSATASVIRCDVEIDAIDSIEIITKTREIVLEDVPEMLEVRAKNAKNDTFTSIGGIQFEWTLTPVDILRYRTWSSSSYMAPPFVLYWESREAKSSTILIEGIRTGSAKVKTRIIGDAHKDVKWHEITLHVIANLGLIPSHDVYLIEGSVIQFRAEMVKQGSKVAVKLPSPQYYLQLSDSLIANLDESTSQIEALKEGHTSLLLRDRNVASSEGSRQPTTDVHVTRPSYMTIHVSPGESFALCESTSYVITLTIHDDWHHRIYSADNLNLKIHFPSRYIHVNSSSLNGTFHMIHTVNTGTTKIKAELIGAGNVKLVTPVELIQDIIVYPSLTLTPSLILLPWEPSIKPSYTVHATAKGATGHYLWLTNNSLVAFVSYDQEESSQVTIVTRGEGDALITCQDRHNYVFMSNLRVSVQRVADIEILPAILETHIGGHVILPIAVYGYEDIARSAKRIFDDCTQIPLSVEIVEKARILYDQNKLVAGLGSRSCRSLSFECISTGNSRVWIKYKTDDELNLSSTAIIGCHAPLTSVHPKEVAVLALGASIDIAFEGGPRAWTLHPNGHYLRLTPSVESIISHELIADRYRHNKDLHVFRVRCEKYGETNLELEVGNIASATLPNPASVKHQIQIVCARPSSLVIKPKLKAGCPLTSLQDSVFPVEMNPTVEIEVQVRDDLGRNFYNISTLSFDWRIDGNGFIEIPRGIKEQINGAKGFNAITRNFQILKEVNSNSTKINAEIIGYKEKFRDKFNIKSEIELIFADKSSIENFGHKTISIFNHPNNKVNLQISKGSGYYSIEVKGSQFINTSYNQQSKQIQILPKRIGNGVLIIEDLCLPTYDSTFIDFSIVEVNAINVEVLDKIQLGNTIEGHLTVIDSNGDNLHVSSHHFLNLVPVLSQRVISVSSFSVLNDWTSSFKVKAEELGFSSFNFVGHENEINVIESPVLSVQVFAPLRIIPDNLTLIIGNQFQVSCIGGPHPQRSIEYSLLDEGIASVDAGGLLTGGKLGITKLVARVLSVDNIEYSRSEIQIYVIALNKIKIKSPSVQLQIGYKLPLQLFGANEHETPFSFGSSDPPLKITWSVSNEKVAVFESTFEKSGIIASDLNAISIRLKGISTGIVTVKVTIESKISSKDLSQQQIVNNKILSDTIHINVFPSFAITSLGQNIEGQTILMSPKSELPLMSTSVGEADIEYYLLNASQIELSCGLERCLRAGESSEITSLLVRSNEKFGVTQTSLFGVKVDSISFLMINSVNVFSLTDSINIFPIGSTLELVVTFHDNIGRSFNAFRSRIRWTLSRNDIISISHGLQNNTLKIRSLKEGNTVFHIFDEENNISEYFQVDVGFLIQPSNININIAEFVCFHSKLSDKFGSWYVDNPLIGDIDKQTGIFIARNIGHTLIGIDSQNGSTYTHVNVSLPKQFIFDTTNVNGVSNMIPLSIPIIIISHTENNLEKSCSSYPLTDKESHSSLEKPFECEISFDNSDRVKPIWNTEMRIDIKSGQWVCDIWPKPDIDIDFAEMALLNSNATISAILLLKTRDYDSSYPPLISKINVPFLPAFHVNTKQIILTYDEPNAHVSVFSVYSVLQDISIVSSNLEIIDITKSEIISNTLKITIHLKNLDLFTNDVSNLHITLSSKTTKQNEKILVQIKLYAFNLQMKSLLLFFTQQNAGTIGSFFVVISILIVSYLIVSKSWQPYKQMSAINLELQNSPFISDTSHRHRALNYSTPQTPISPSSSSSPTRIGRPLYSVRNT